MKNNFFNYFILLVFALSLNSCGGGCDECDDWLYDGSAEFGSAGYIGGDIELSDCDIKKNEINSSYSEKINKVHAKADSLFLAIDQFETEYFDNYATHFNNIIIVFESEGGDLIKLDEQQSLLDEEIDIKIVELNETPDFDSPEWRDKITLLEIEIEELRLELYSVAGIETQALVTDFLAFIKESLLEYNELEDNRLDYLKNMDSEIERLNNERDTAIEALNCT